MENAGLYGVSLLTPDQTFDMKRQKHSIAFEAPRVGAMRINRNVKSPCVLINSSSITLPSTHHLRISAEV